MPAPAVSRVNGNYFMIDLTGVRVLIAEDEFIIAMMLESEVRACGGHVLGPFGRVGETLQAVREMDIDLALLDVKLRGELVTAVAKELEERQVPILLHTAYGVDGLPPELAGLPMLQKPHDSKEICRLIHELYRRRPGLAAKAPSLGS
jgi:DNA-binding LytR/AlgR family response regulator